MIVVEYKNYIELSANAIYWKEVYWDRKVDQNKAME